MKTFFRRIATFLYFLIASLFLNGQNQTVKIKGTVLGDDGKPLVGATITEKGTQHATMTDQDGKFELNVLPNATLVFSYVGYETAEQVVKEQGDITVVLRETITELEDVVVIGYGTQKKRDVTGSIVSIKGEQIEKKAYINPLSALQGSVAGLIITNSGVAGASPDVRIRGVGSISNTSPLYIVDGVFTDNINFLNSNEIASIEILKDPSSLAMFGVQGANGVIIITTRRPQKGETLVQLNSYYGIQRVTNPIKLTNAEEFKTLFNEQLTNTGKAPFDFSRYTGNTDWQSLILRDAIITNNNISITSGSEKNEAVVSISYFKQEGVVKYDMNERITAHLNERLILSKHVTIGGDINASRWNGTPGTNLLGALWAAPVVEPKDQVTGVWNSMPDFQKAQVANPVAIMEIYKGKNIQKGYRFVGSAFLEINFLKNFTWKSTVYGDLGFDETQSYTPKYYIGLDSAIQNSITAVSQGQTNYTTWQSDQTLTWTKNTGLLSATLLAGMTAQYKGNTYLGGSRQGIATDIPDDPIFWYLNIGTTNINEHNYGGGEEQAFISYLFRANLAFADKYLLNLSFRRDGTSKFSPTHKWGNFPSVGAGWIMSEENFFSGIKDIINFLKIKASWGRLGNDKIGNYLYYPVLNTGVSAVFGENIYQAVVPAYSPDENIHWEVMEGSDAGIELSAWKGQLRIEGNYYHRKTSDILVSLETPGAAGVGSKLTNAGTILNKGIELSLLWRQQINKDWQISLGANLTTIHNEVLSIGDNIGYTIIQGPSITTVGQPIGEFYGYVQEGIFQNQEEINSYAKYKLSGKPKPGDIKYKDINGDSIIDSKDRTYIGSPTPNLTYGASISVGYKNLELSADIQGVKGNYVYRQWATATFASLNYPANRMDRWRGEGTSNLEPILDNTRANNFLTSTYWLDKADYFRIRNVSLTYNLNNEFFKNTGIKGGKIFITVQNLKTFTKAKGYSPEVGGSPVSYGVDNGTYPVPAVYTLGLNLNF